MKVLIDYDHPYPQRGWIWRRGKELIKYAVLNKIGLKNNGSVSLDTDEYLETLLRLNALCGVETVIGLRDIVEAEKPHLRKMIEKYNTDLRRHIHIGENSDPNRRRIWVPSLNQSVSTWHYDQDYAAGRKPKIEKDDLPVFHADYPQLINDYIRFLYEWKILGVSPY